MSTVDWVTVEHRGCREGRFRNMFLGWEVAKSSCLSRTPGYLSSDLLPGARGQGKSQPGGLGFQSDLESKWNRKLLTREDLWQGRPLDLLFQANKSRTERLPSLASPREWGWGQLEEEPGGWAYCAGSGGHGVWASRGVCILHASGWAPVFISHFLIFKNIKISHLG